MNQQQVDKIQSLLMQINGKEVKERKEDQFITGYFSVSGSELRVETPIARIWIPKGDDNGKVDWEDCQEVSTIDEFFNCLTFWIEEIQSTKNSVRFKLYLYS